MNYKDMLREKLTINFVKTCKKINCTEVVAKEIKNKLILSYKMLDENKLVEMEFINGFLNRIHKGGELTFDYNAIE